MKTKTTNDIKNLRLKISECGKSLESCGIINVTIAKLNPCGSLTLAETNYTANKILNSYNHYDELIEALANFAEATDLDSPQQVELAREKAANILAKIQKTKTQ